MKKFLTLFFFCHVTCAVKHSLKFHLTGTSGETNFPEFVGAAAVDGVMIGHCDSIIRRVEPKHNWIRRLIEGNPEHLQWYSQKCLVYHQRFKSYIEDFKQHLNQTKGSHVLQRISGCEWDDESGEVKGFNYHGYDGDDFISLDLKTKTWITSRAEAAVVKHLWNADKVRLEYKKNLYKEECPKFLQEYILYGRSFLQRTERPSVSLLQKTPSSPVSCHATGFYPHRAKLFWRKDGEEIHEDVKRGEILPNNDGTFQMSSELSVSLVKHENWRKYDCVFQLSGVKEEIITTLDKAKIQTNWVSPSEFPVPSAVGGAAGMVLLLVFSGVLYYCWRKRNDFQSVHGKC
ncbi:major histocompatibility complex class I-related gene protein-like [Oryzias melastigma]|uniref:major histocompatibility complex class I-related gene protein-like n=1 Tax=Oryzias melastigma TaxID=30732 RepID=UPI00168D1B5D|nr:major histocompatibility complex class I-related gene protein-like [Oryzias melastigma]